MKQAPAKPVGARSASEIGLASNQERVHFQCGTCDYFARGTCHNPNPQLQGRDVKPEWCCNLYDHPQMRIIV